MRYTRYLIALFVVVLIIFVFLLSSIYQDVKKQAIQDLNQQQIVHANQAARGIEEHMNQIISTLNGLAQIPGIIDFNDEGIKIMAYYARSLGDEIRGVTRVDEQGKIIYSLPYLEGTVGRDISGQEHIKQIMKTHETVVSDVFKAVQGFSAIAVHVPVFKDDKFTGTIAFLLSFDHIARRYIENIEIGSSGYAWVISKKGTEISCPIPGHEGKSVYDNCKDFPDIIAMAKEMVKGKSGVTTYYFDQLRAKKIDRAIKHAVYMPIPLGDTYWSIVVATPEDEVLSSLKGLRLKLILIVISILALCVVCTYLVVRSGIMAREQKKRELIGKALEESEVLYRALIETTNTGFVVVGTNGEVIDANQEYVRMTGYRSVGDIRGRSVVEWTAEHEKEKNQKAIEHCMKTGFVRNLEVDYVNGDGDITPIEINATMVTKDGVSQIMALCRDIRDRKKLETQLIQAQKMESIGRLAGGVAHDFNNVLTVIIGYTEMALERVSPTEALHRHLEEILKAGKRSAALTRQLLGFARKQIIIPRILDLNETVSGMLKMLQRLIGEDINLVWMPGHDLWNVRIDPSQIDQILANLVVNSKDAISGTGVVMIETANTIIDDAYCEENLDSCAGDFVMLAVSDNGSGMSQDLIANVFEPFFTTKEVGEGTGLGLATVYGIVKQNGGFVNIQSQLNTGTIIKIYLPRTEKETVEVPQDQQIQYPPQGSETILLIEDDVPVLTMVKGVLEGLGYAVLAASKPSQAITLAEQNHESIHLVITDVIMPEMNGKDLMAKLRPVMPLAKCLFISGYTANVIAHHGVLDAGVSFIQKPFSVQVLAEKVRSVLDESG
jgi:PAS domain S-box-containing protein